MLGLSDFSGVDSLDDASKLGRRLIRTGCKSVEGISSTEGIRFVNGNSIGGEGCAKRVAVVFVVLDRGSSNM